FPDRFAAAAEAGFTAIEYLFPYEHDAQRLADKLATHGMKQALFNLPPGDWNAGEKGFAALPERREHFLASLQTALPYALATKVPNVHLMAGIAPADDSAAIACFRESIVMAADFFGAH